MAYEIPGMQISLEAAVDLSTKQFHFVKLDGNGRIIAIAAGTDKPIGILQDKPKQGAAGNVMLDGVSKLVSDVAIPAGSGVGTSADGQGTIGGTLGQALKTTNAAGEMATVAFSCIRPS
jgi:hypothetical protein